MTAKKQTSKTGPGKKDGKHQTRTMATSSKKTAKYTLTRDKEHLKNLEKVREHLKKESWRNDFKTDSEIYRILPAKYLNAVKTIASKDQVIVKLTAKEEQLAELRKLICRIIKIVTEVK